MPWRNEAVFERLQQMEVRVDGSTGLTMWSREKETLFLAACSLSDVKGRLFA